MLNTLVNLEHWDRITFKISLRKYYRKIIIFRKRITRKNISQECTNDEGILYKVYI